jgi:hypothetical protein
MVACTLGNLARSRVLEWEGGQATLPLKNWSFLRLTPLPGIRFLSVCPTLVRSRTACQAIELI